MAQEKNDRIVCLFGSGISIPAGVMSTEDLTRRLIPPTGLFLPLLGGNYTFHRQVVRHSFDPHRHHCDAVIATVKAASELTRIGFREFGMKPDAMNYEDVAYTISQVCTAESGDRDDATAAIGRRCILRRVAALLPACKMDLLSLLSTTLDALNDLVCELLREPCREPHYLRLLDEMIKKRGPERFVIVTTNHETLIEDHLTRFGIPFADGFSADINGARLWQPETTLRRPGCVQLMKLHGSMNWFQLMPHGGDDVFRHEIATIPVPVPNPFIYNHPDGTPWVRADVHPLTLIGTFNKVERYTSGMFAELFCRFRTALLGARTLLVCGYGFRDFGINRLLFGWAYRDRDRRMIVIDPKWDNIRGPAGTGIARSFDELRGNSILEVIQKRVEDPTLSDEIERMLTP